jgi:TPR repeat protein
MGARKKLDEAKKWFRKAAEQGVANAKEALRALGQ